MNTFNKEKLHKLLEKQVKRLGLSFYETPSQLEVWQDFIKNINKVYQESDQERELLERSMMLSSSEFITLNKRLLETQKIAQLGYWVYDVKTNTFTISSDLASLIELGTGQIQLSFNEFISYIHNGESKQFKYLIEYGSKNIKDKNMELRFKKGSGYQWFNVTTHPTFWNKVTIKVTGIMMNINPKKEAQLKVEKMHKEMLDMARQAGMSDVATSILHNVGNSLNNINVSFKIVSDFFNSEKIEKLHESIHILESHLFDLGSYLVKDPKGQLLPKFIIAIDKSINQDRINAAKELNFLNDSIQHINTVISAQSNLGGMVGFREKIYLPKIIDDALKMIGLIDMPGYNKIQVSKKYQEKPYIYMDKTKLLQILVNLLKNAKDSLDESTSDNKKIIIGLKSDSKNNKIEICVQDTGLGILPENLIKIFRQGFTTKKKGHGFGLHGSALAAKSMKGELTAFSQGLGQGATFVLTLPQDTPPSLHSNGVE